jgi:hypothetical protein
MALKMTHPALGVLTTILVVFIALLITAAMAPQTLMSWVGLFLVAMVSPQIVLSLALQGQHPVSVAKLPQPWKGLGLCLLTVVVGGVIALIANATVGGGITPPTPFVNMYLILAVTVTLALVVPFQCWPFSAIFPKKPLAMGVSVLVAAYAIAAILYYTLFNFDFLKGAPFYRADLNPHGLFLAWVPLIFALTCFVVILCLVLLDFWPMSLLPPRMPAFGKQPLFGIVSSIFIALVSLGVWWFFVDNLKMDMVDFMTRCIIALIFGIFIFLVMLEGAPFISLSQPGRGIVLIVLSIILAQGSFVLYTDFCHTLFGLPAGPPSYAAEIWLANAMLAVTFPLMVAYAIFLHYWPLQEASPGEESAPAGE